jgi:hypothetical protein
LDFNTTLWQFAAALTGFDAHDFFPFYHKPTRVQCKGLQLSDCMAVVDICLTWLAANLKITIPERLSFL